MSKWQAIITKVDNGFNIDFEGGDNPCANVYQEKEHDMEEDKEHIVKMFYDILDFFGEFGSKHDKKRIFIEWKKQ